MSTFLKWLAGAVVTTMFVLAVKEGIGLDLKTGEWAHDREKREQCEVYKYIRSPMPEECHEILGR